MAVNPQRVVGNGRQVVFPITDLQLGGNWEKGDSRLGPPSDLAQGRGSSQGLGGCRIPVVH